MSNTPTKKTTTETTKTTQVVESTSGATPTAKPSRPTVASLKQEVEQLRDTVKTFPQVDSLTKATARRVDDLWSALALFEQNEDQDSNEFLAAGRLKKLENMAAAVMSLSSDVTDLEERLNKKIDDNYTELKGDVERVDGRINRSNGRIHSLESYRDKVEWWPLIIGAIVTVIVAIWLIPHVFMTDPIPLPDGTSLPAQPDTDMNSWWWKGLVLGGILLGIAGLGTYASRVMSRMSRSRKERRREQEASRPVPVIPAPSTPVVHSITEDTTPTKPYDTRTPVGATSGSH